MTSTLAKKAGLKLFEQHVRDYTPADPLYEEYVDPKSGKKKRRKRELPPGLSKRDAKILMKVKKRAHYLDKGFTLCGMRFGWTFWIGLIPFAGDIADASLNYLLIVRPSQRAEIPPWLLRKMLLNNTISACVGFIPLAGDVILASFKANSRNAALLEEYLRIRGEEFLSVDTRRAMGDVEGIKPGAGRKPGERVEGLAGAATNGGSLASRKSASKAAATTSSAAGALNSKSDTAAVEAPPARSGSFWSRKRTVDGKGKAKEGL